MNNYMKLTIPSKTSNEAFARAAGEPCGSGGHDR